MRFRSKVGLALLVAAAFLVCVFCSRENNHFSGRIHARNVADGGLIVEIELA